MWKGFFFIYMYGGTVVHAAASKQKVVGSIPVTILCGVFMFSTCLCGSCGFSVFLSRCKSMHVR